MKLVKSQRSFGACDRLFICMTYLLERLATDKDWLSYNNIRKEELFADIDYENNHPDEKIPDNYPLLLKLDNKALATVRVDIRENIAILRLLAVTKSEQYKGHGKQLLLHIEEFVKKHDVTKLAVNSDSKAVGYYQKIGFKKEMWDKNELQGIAEDCVQMTKKLYTS